MQKWATELATRNKQKSLSNSASEEKGSSGKRKKRKIDSSATPKQSNSPGSQQGYGGYIALDFLDGSLSREYKQLANYFLDKHRTKIIKKVNMPEKIIPFIWMNPTEVIPKLKKEIKSKPIILLRSRLTSYMTEEMKLFCSAIEYLAETEGLTVLYYKRWTKFGLKKDGLHDIYPEDILALKPSKIFIPTCGCAGGGAPELNIWNSISQKHDVHIYTHYDEYSNCGCRTFADLQSNTKIKIHFSFI